MNQNFYLKCLTCGTKYRIRVQAGFFYSIPFVYQCPECKVVSKGEVELPVGKEPLILLSNLKNSIQSDSEIDDKYVLQLSTELYTDKMMRSDGAGPLHAIINLSPFMQYTMDGKGFIAQNIAFLTEELISNLALNSNDYTAIWDLYEQNSQKYLYEKLKKLNIFQKKMKYYKFEKLKDNKKIEFLPRFLYGSLLATNYYKSKEGNIVDFIRTSRKKNYLELKKIHGFISSHHKKDLGKIIQINKFFFGYYNYILPVIANESTGAYDIKKIKEIKGISQTDFENIKKYYAENFENLKDLIILYILLQNLQIRGDIRRFHQDFYRDFERAFKNKDFVNDFNNVITKVGNRTKILFYDENTLLDKDILESVFDNDIRNSINHQDYSYDYNNQKIVFLNNGIDREVYLIEFAELLFLGLILANISWDAYMLLMEIFNIKTDI